LKLRLYIKNGHRLLCSLLFAFSCLVTANIYAADPIELYRTYSGNIDYIAVGASYRDEPNGIDSCSFVNPMSTQVVVNIPGNATVIEAFLYIGASGNDDLGNGPIHNMSTQVGLTLNAIPISTGAGGANENYEINNVAGGSADFFAARRDVSNIVTGPGIYTFAGLDVHTVADGRVNNQTCLGAWELVVVYNDPAVTNVRIINLFDGFQDFQNNQTGFFLEPRNFVLLQNAKGKVTHITYEGDETLGAGPEFAASNGNCPACEEKFKLSIPTTSALVDLINPPLNPANNQFNGTVTGPDVFNTNASYGLDLDTYNIDDFFNAAGGEYSAQTGYFAAQDLVILQAEVFVVENKAIADIEVDVSAVGSFVENNTGQYRITVTNNGDGTGVASTGNATGFIQVFADLPPGITWSSFSTSGWSCNETIATSDNRIRCSFDLSTLTGGVAGLDATDSLTDILVNVAIGTPGATVDMSTWAFSCFNANQATAAIVNNGTMSDCDGFTEKHGDPTPLDQFDNRGFFEAANTSYFSVTTKSQANNNVDFLEVSILSNTESDLSTSTKTVTDLNGGDVEVNDTLEYQIVISETAGNATSGGVVLTDLIDSDTTYVFGSLSVIGSPYTVVSTGSTLELDGLVIAASSSITVSFSVTVNSTAAGQTIENSVILINANGPDASAAIATQFVAIDNNIGNKPLYLDINSAPNGALTRTIPAGDTSSGALAQNVSADYTLANINNSLSVVGGDMPLSLWIVNEAGTGEKSIEVTLFDELSLILGSASLDFTLTVGESELVPFIINTPAFSLNNTTNRFIRVRVQNTSVNLADEFSIHSKLTSVSSSLALDSQTVISVDALIVRDGTCISGGALLSANTAPGNAVCIEAIVSDPFGEYDIQPTGQPSLTITDPDALSSYTGTFTEISGSPDDQTTFEWDFVIPASGPSLGQWDINLSVDEGDEGTISDSASTSFQTANEPDLSSSVKSVVNIDSAVNRPGDTLRYTITLSETNGGDAIGVSIFDYIPPATNNLNIISFPFGATNNSTSTVIDINNITVSANSTESVIFEVDISLGTPIGSRIDNTAQIDEPNGGDIDVVAQSIFVYGAPSNGSKLLYLDDLDVTNALTRDEDESNAAGDNTDISLAGIGDSVTITQSPPTAKPLTLNAGPINVNTWLHRNDKGAANPRIVEFQLGYQSGAGGGGSTGIIDTETQSVVLGEGAGNASLITTVMTLASDVQLNSNTEIFLRITNNTVDNTNRQTSVSTFLNSVPSTIELDAETVINIDSITIYDDTGGGGSAGAITTTPAPSDTIHIQAVVSDPFGEADIQPNGNPTLVITDPDTATVNPNSTASYESETTFTEIVDGDAGTRTYNWEFIVPAAPAPPTQGTWSVQLTADEGDEGTISNTAAVVFNTDSVSDLTQSTKSVVDKFGGETEPGDVLVYTITLANTTDINANNVSVTDFLNANLGALDSITIPAGAIDNSTVGTGPLNINNITVPNQSTDLYGNGNGIAVITFEVTVDPSAQPGDLVNNTAGINNPAGVGANPAAPSLTVSPSLIPSSGNKILYLNNLADFGTNGGTGDLSRTATASTSNLTIDEQGGTASFSISPEFKKDLTLEPGPIPVSLWLSSSESGNKARQITVDLSYSGTSTGTIGTQSQVMNLNGTAIEASFYINLATQTTLLAGTSMDLTVTNNIGNANRDADITSNSTTQINAVELNASTVINIDSIDVYDAAFSGGSIVTTIIPPGTVYIRAIVSDPFGGFDINPNCVLATPSVNCPSISLTGPDDDSDNGNMTLVDDPSPDDGTRTFEYSFVLPTLANEPAGQWDISITADEGTEGTVSHSAFGSFSTENIPNLSTSMKSVVDKFGGEPDAGDVLIYTIDIFETGGATETVVSVIDILPGNLTYIPATLTLCQDSSAPLDNCVEPVISSGGFTGSNLAITGLTVPANGRVQIQFEATIDAGANPGDLVNNTATITNPNGPGAVIGAPSLVVSPSQIGVAGAKDIYLTNLNTSRDLTRIDPIAAGDADTTVHLNGGDSTSFALTPATSLPLTLGNGPIPVYLAINGDNKNNRTRDIQVTLSYSGGSNGTIGSDITGINLTNNTNAIVIVPFSIDLAADLALAANTTLSLAVSNNSNANEELDIHSFDSGFASKIQLNANTVVNVDNVEVYDVAYPAGSIVTSRNPGQTAFIRAVVSDPFGSFDINPGCPAPPSAANANCPSITISGPVDELVNAHLDMKLDPTDGTKTFEYAYLVPPQGLTAGQGQEDLGLWDITVTANEGTEGTIDHTAVANFSTANDPNLSTSEKQVVDKFGGDADPGDVLVYTINIYETGGSQEIGVTITDVLPSNTTYVPGSLTICQDITAPFDDCLDPVVFTGGVSSGTLSLTDVTVPANSLVSIEFEVTINGAALPGDFVDNSATIYNPNGPGAGVQAPSIIVSLSLLGSAGAKNLYLEDLSGTPSLTRTVPTANSTEHLNGAGPNFNLSQSAPTEKELTLGSGPINGQIFVNGDNGNGTRSIDVTLGYSGPSSGTIGSDTISISLTNNTANILAAPFAIGLASDLTLPVGTVFELNITNSSPNANREIDVQSFPSLGNYSYIGLNANTVINIDLFEIYDDSFVNGGGSITSSATAGESLFLRATVSDPFGAFDINPLCTQNTPTNTCPTISFTGPVDDTPSGFMTRLDDDTADGEHLYEFEFPVPDFVDEAEGQWDVSITAHEGTEGTIEHSAVAVFFTNDTPDISTSTKTVVDQNGGDVEPGDTLEYTITISETNDAVATVSLFDVIDSNTTNLTISNNGGGTVNGSAPADTVDITSIGVPALGSVDVVFTVDVIGGLAAGTLLNNSASVINPDGPSGSATAETLIVSESQLASVGTKALYLDTLNTGSKILTRQQPALTEAIINSSSNTTIDLSPAFETDITLAAGDLTVFLWLHRTGTDTNRSVNVQLSYFGASSGIIDDDNQFVSLGNNLATGTRVPFVLNIPGDITLLKGTQLRLTISNQTATAGENLIFSSFNSGKTEPFSQVNLNSLTVINIDEIKLYDAAHGGATVTGLGNQITSAQQGDIIFLRAIVSDPFGSFDINVNCPPATTLDVNCPPIDVKLPGGASITTGNMEQVFEDVGNGIKIYEFQYSIPPMAASGFWEAEVIVIEGEELEITHNANQTFFVGTPQITLLHFTNGSITNADPNSDIIYTVRVTHTSGPTATGLELKGFISEFVQLNADKYGSLTPFQLDNGFSLTLQEFSVDADGIAIVYDHTLAAPYDGDVTHYRVVISEPINAGESFDMTYEVKVQ
jgi:uncharacterized repeat protein (TIGR01451 family)